MATFRRATCYRGQTWEGEALGIFGRSEAREKAQFTAAYNKRFDEFYAAEMSRTGGWVSRDSLLEIESFAAVWALDDTYRPGQRIRVTEEDTQRMFQAKLLEDMSTMSDRLKRMRPEDIERALAAERKPPRFGAEVLFTRHVPFTTDGLGATFHRERLVDASQHWTWTWTYDDGSPDDMNRIIWTYRALDKLNEEFGFEG